MRILFLSSNHEVGLKIVSEYLGLHGWQTCYTGASTPQFSILKLIDTFRPRVAAFSITMAMYIPGLIDLIDSIKKVHHNRVKILLGGYLLNEEPVIFQSTKADAYAKNPLEALAVIEKLYEETVSGNI